MQLESLIREATDEQVKAALLCISTSVGAYWAAAQIDPPELTLAALVAGNWFLCAEMTYSREKHNAVIRSITEVIYTNDDYPPIDRMMGT